MPRGCRSNVTGRKIDLVTLRRGSSHPVDFGFPFGFIAMDGKCLSAPAADHKYSPSQTRTVPATSDKSLKFA